MTDMNFLESLIGEGVQQIIGDPFLIGILILGFFGAFVFLQGTRTDAKLVVIVPAFILAIAFIGAIKVLFGLALAGIVFFAYMKFMNR